MPDLSHILLMLKFGLVKGSGSATIEYPAFSIAQGYIISLIYDLFLLTNQSY